MEPSAVAVEAAAVPMPSEAVLRGKNALKEAAEGVLYGSVSRRETSTPRQQDTALLTAAPDCRDCW